MPDRSAAIVFTHHSVVPNVPDDLVEKCLTPIGAALFEIAGLPALDGTRASGDCAWRRRGRTATRHLRPANLPSAVRKDWVVNANDS